MVNAVFGVRGLLRCSYVQQCTLPCLELEQKNWGCCAVDISLATAPFVNKLQNVIEIGCNEMRNVIQQFFYYAKLR